ncbi:iron-sulfur cluster transporter [Rhodopirellula bahusiensis]|uniref:Iron-sulfur cluster transporter n=1 Tax=Rhodopirellula bahusiensis TaxID=2014065 RepID=A0A2G1WC31_9BACT|nr:iron-sulfur cluster transporter [Rhodopirellula bahusiensis]PHQ36598.1 iron-sulfur cluster transporter [Rhodopirellula bahusiensis]
MPPIESASANTMHYLVLGLAAGYACLGCIVLYGLLSSHGKAREQRLEELRAKRESKLAANRNESSPQTASTNIDDSKEIRLLRAELARFIKVSASITNESQNLHLEVAALRMRIEALENELAGHFEDHNQIDSIRRIDPKATATKPPKQSANPTTIAVVSEEPTESHGETQDKNGIPIREHEELGLLYMARPKSPDDLTQIWGIGVVQQTELQEHGIFYHHQIAAWSAEQVGHFDNWMKLQGRIKQEMWVPQAIRLSRQKAGKKAAKKKKKQRERRAA